jgi:hypothetical protein
MDTTSNGFLLNVVILGLASIWWFETETDGFSQVFGVLYYCIPMGVIGVINLVVLLLIKFKKIKLFS